MQQTYLQQLFKQYKLKPRQSLLTSLPPMEDQLKIRALVEGAMLRNKLRLYRGDKDYVEDLQIILDHDVDLAPLVMKEHKIMVYKDGLTVMNQCVDCGRYMPPFKYCSKCQHIHYCSQACEMRSKLTHESSCKPKILPAIDTALQIEIHVGSDLGRDVEMYYQHQMKISHKIKGEEFVKGMFQYFVGEGKVYLPDDSRPEIINGHLKIARVVDSSPPASETPFDSSSLDKIADLYTSNRVLAPLTQQILKKGGILTNLVREIHNNHIHLIYIFLCP